MSEVHPTIEAIQQKLQSPEPVKWLFTGDSITQGALHTMGHRDYTQHFAERVRWELRRTQDCVINNGCNGWKITAAAENLEVNVLQFKPDVVFLNFGVNDCCAGADGRDDFKKTYNGVLDRIHAEANSVVVLQTPNGILPLDELRFSQLPAYIETVREIAAKRELLLIDHAGHWAESKEKGTMLYWLSDAVHPNEYGHRAMAHTLLRDLGLFDEDSNMCRLLVP